MKPLPTIATLAFSIAAALGSTPAVAAPQDWWDTVELVVGAPEAPLCSQLTPEFFQDLWRDGSGSCIYNYSEWYEKGLFIRGLHYLRLSPDSTPKLLISTHSSYYSILSSGYPIRVGTWIEEELYIQLVQDWWISTGNTIFIGGNPGASGETFPNLTYKLADLFGANNSVLFNPEGANMVTTAPTPNYSPAYSTAFSSSSPVPEPETWAMLLAGLGIVGAIARRPRTT